jgi:histidyl-tRNA synthetase
LSTLTGKYGDEGDKLIFKILNSGDYLSKADSDHLSALDSNALIKSISEKALRYDLTVPFARYVVMHQNEIALPFKRFQVQPVWRADRPQKGRYREFYQCDVDVVGSESLLNEAEFILIYQEALTNLGMSDFTIKINNRKILSGIAEIIGKPDLIVDMTVAIDKLDKVGLEGVVKELLGRGFVEADIALLKPVILLQGSNEEKLFALKGVLSKSEIGLKGIAELEKVFEFVEQLLSGSDLKYPNLELDITLARGLNYYTGCIFEVKTNEVAMGSIGGGGRYDDLTGMFGLKGLTGVGISFGADRIYELNLFPPSGAEGTKVLISNFDADAEGYALPLLQRLREHNIAAELYPSSTKLKKQMSYADAKLIPYVILIGSDEMRDGVLTLKNMNSGDQQKLDMDSIIALLSKS